MSVALSGPELVTSRGKGNLRALNIFLELIHFEGILETSYQKLVSIVTTYA